MDASDWTPHILLVDDSPTRLLDQQLKLQNRGYRVTTARDGREAMSHLRELVPAQAPDLVVSDVNMPALDGVQLVQAIKRSPLLAGIPVVLFTTTREDARDASQPLKGAALAYLKGAIDATELDAAIEAKLRAMALQRRLKGVRERLDSPSRPGTGSRPGGRGKGNETL